MNNLLEKIKGLGAKKLISYGATFIIGSFLGIGMGASGMVSEKYYNDLNSKYETVNSELGSSKNRVNELQAKVDEAKPFFKMNDEAKEAMKIETAKKEEEAKKQAELDARSVTLGNGTYLVDKDIPEGGI